MKQFLTFMNGFGEKFKWNKVKLIIRIIYEISEIKNYHYYWFCYPDQYALLGYYYVDN